MNDIKVLFRKTNSVAKTPLYQHNDDSGADLYSVVDFVLEPGEIKLIPTGISIEITKGIEAQLRPKSGLSLKGLSIVNTPATIDAGYRGEIKVPLINLGKNTLEFKCGDKIAQIVFAPVYRGHFIEVNELNDTLRSEGGFGSTGKR